MRQRAGNRDTMNYHVGKNWLKQLGRQWKHVPIRKLSCCD